MTLRLEHAAAVAALSSPTILVVLDADPALAKVGHHTVGDGFVETWWLPIVGPTSVVMLRCLASERCADDGIVDLGVLAAALGLGKGTGPNSPVVLTLARLVGFGLIRVTAGAPPVVTVPLLLPPFPDRLRHRLPERLRAEAL